ncbi:alginate lyase family protein [Gracilibacillus phocaeensis]|uniref:alginate lyase family protein n=1 Tax=Gracilibacillus phocaeensis TaxID=2042304 RepID=UPI00257021D8|nr:alginate lyase family protein [Gracilibacillus phocaeensis]
MCKPNERWLALFSKDYCNWTLKKANESLKNDTLSITEVVASHSAGNKHDFYSNADYWWYNPDTNDGLPYIQRDGESNPHNFLAHRQILRSMRTNVAHLAAGYLLTQNELFAEKAVDFLHTFFVENSTRMNPHLSYAQAIPGVCTGRSFGIIDTLHLVDIPMAIRILQSSPALTDNLLTDLKQWFKEYLQWMHTHPYGVEESKASNNHSVCWFVQAASFATLVGDEDVLNFCREAYKSRLLPNQMAEDGSFPRELARTKPYSYSIFVLDNMVTLTHLLTNEHENLWDFQLADGRGIQKGLHFLFPYLQDKSQWPYRGDVEHFEGWPARVSFLLFAGNALQKKEFIDLWNRLDIEPTDTEVRRNIAIRQPLLWG